MQSLTVRTTSHCSETRPYPSVTVNWGISKRQPSPPLNGSSVCSGPRPERSLAEIAEKRGPLAKVLQATTGNGLGPLSSLGPFVLTSPACLVLHGLAPRNPLALSPSLCGHCPDPNSDTTCEGALRSPAPLPNCRRNSPHTLAIEGIGGPPSSPPPPLSQVTAPSRCGILSTDGQCH